MIPRRKRRVRLHFVRDAAPSIEGIFKGFWADHYVIAVPALLNGQEQVRFEGPTVRVHKQQVSLMEDLL